MLPLSLRRNQRQTNKHSVFQLNFLYETGGGQDLAPALRVLLVTFVFTFYVPFFTNLEITHCFYDFSDHLFNLITVI